MYLNQIHIHNIRSISDFVMAFEPGKQAGWHILIGDNGTGKTTVIRAIALGLCGAELFPYFRLNVRSLLRNPEMSAGYVALNLSQEDGDRELQVKLDVLPNGILKESGRSDLTYAQNRKNSWFSASYGPFRRLANTNVESSWLHELDPRVAAHISAFEEDFAFAEVEPWLKNLKFKELENRATGPVQIEALKSFINQGDLLPHGIRLDEVTSDGVIFQSRAGNKLKFHELSDGYRSVLSLTLELIRQIDLFHRDNINENADQPQAIFEKRDNGSIVIARQGVVMIDEVDAHLHPTWQTRIGQWFTRYFPQIQFIVTTHSPLVCRAAVKGTIWRLATPGSDTPSGQVSPAEKDRLVFGDILDAYDTDVFGDDILRGQEGIEQQKKYRDLTYKHMYGQAMTKEETAQYQHLKSIFHTDVTLET